MAPDTLTRRGSEQYGIRRLTRTVLRPRRSTTPGSASPLASLWVSLLRHGWSRTGAARSIPLLTGVRIPAAGRPAQTSTDIGAVRSIPGPAAGTRVVVWQGLLFR